MDQIYLWCVTGMAVLLSVSTLWRLISERQRLTAEDLNDSDRAFAWRVVIFLAFPLLNFVDLRATMVCCEWLGGYIQSWSYGLFWYHCLPAGLPSSQALLVVLLSGVVAQLLLAMCLIPALLFRPHPFLATVIGYSIVFIFGFNLALDPLMSLAGLGSPRWQVLYGLGSSNQHLLILTTHLSLLLLFALLVRNRLVRMWFADLSRPPVTEDLKKALAQWKSNPNQPATICRLALQYLRAGLQSMAWKQLKRLEQTAPHSLLYHFLKALLHYRRRNYSAALQAFLDTANFSQVDGELKSKLLAAAACSSFALGKSNEAINLSQQALEFAPDCLVARMVKVDVLLKQGKKDEAGEEILLAMKAGMVSDLESKIPLDTERTLDLICLLPEPSTATEGQPPALVLR